MGVKDYDLNPDNNTQINGINIAEGCPPSGINNAIRQLMADVKADKVAQDKATVKAVNGNAPDAAGNITPEQTGCLPLTGGAMTGNLNFNIPGTEDHIGNIIAVNDENGKRLVIDTYEEGDSGAFITFRKGSDIINPGGFEINVRNADNSVIKYMAARLDGTFVWDGSEVFLPAGAVFAFAGNTDVPGCLICNGAAISRSIYWRLFTAIGTTYGAGDGSTTFNIPYLTDKFIQGSDTAGTVKAAGLPDAYGAFNPTGLKSNAGTYGVFSVEGNPVVDYNVGTREGYGARIDMLLSRSNTIYGASNTVQPPAVTMRYYIKY